MAILDEKIIGVRAEEDGEDVGDETNNDDSGPGDDGEEDDDENLEY